MKTKPKVD